VLVFFVTSIYFVMCLLTASAITCAAFINSCNRHTFCIIVKSIAGYRTGVIIKCLCKTKGKYKGGYLKMNNSFCSLHKLAVCSKLGSLLYMGHTEHEKWVLDGSTSANCAARKVGPAIRALSRMIMQANCTLRFRHTGRRISGEKKKTALLCDKFT
jgi:hypothetical protein